MDKLVLYATDDRIGMVALNRPSKLNAINAELRGQLVDALRRADAEPSTSVVILRAEGRSFCAGFDIGGGDAEKDGGRHDALRWHAHLRDSMAMQMMPWEMKKPVIASVQGHVLGGGCEIAMLCDLTIAADNAVFGEPEIRFSDVGPAVVMPHIIGLKKARELLYFGDSIDAETALRLGMVNRVVPLAELPEVTLKYARRLALIAPEALYATKLAINRGADAGGFHGSLNAGLDIVAPLYAARTEVGQRFSEITRKDGLGAALKWRAAQFAE
jgi:enoyl-CoA hydratase/carnithine racemase